MFKKMIITFSYFKEGVRRIVLFDETCEFNDFTAKVSVEEKAGVKTLRVTVLPESELVAEQLFITLEYQFSKTQRIFANGYQSWTDSRELQPRERMRGITKLARPIMEKYQINKYGDYLFHGYSGKKGEFHGYTYGYVREGLKYDLIGSLSEKEGFTVIEYFCRDNKIKIFKDCKGLHIKNGYDAFDLIFARGDENFVFDGWFGMMEKTDPEKGDGPVRILNRYGNRAPMTGWTSWYNYYQDINEDIILENLENIQNAKKRIDIFQIDDGYQCTVGDWLKVDSKKFPGGMKRIADAVKSKGIKAGIWLAPFVCETDSDIFRDKKEWLLKDEEGRPVLAGSNWSRFYALDFGNSEVKDYIRKVFRTVFEDWGYDMVKLDFLYAVCLKPGKYETRGGVMTEAMRFIRECAGDRLVLGCGVPLGPSFGLVDYCRIGCDVRFDWNDRLYMRRLLRERDSTLNAIMNAIGRRHLDGRAFLNDPDVFMLRDDNIKLSDAQKHTLFTAAQIFGSLLFTSDNTGAYNSDQWDLYNKMRNPRPVNVDHVEYTPNGLIEVAYKDLEEKRAALINLGKRKLKYTGNLKFSTEIIPGRDEPDEAPSVPVIMNSYQTRIFTLDHDRL